MTYNKRWYLIHILGGKCVGCDEDNLYELEIDHIDNDGYVEREYHTNMLKEYIHNPIKAKERLQILCRVCHNLKHHPDVFPLKLTSSEEEIQKWTKTASKRDIIRLHKRVVMIKDIHEANHIRFEHNMENTV